MNTSGERITANTGKYSCPAFDSQACLRSVFSAACFNTFFSLTYITLFSFTVFCWMMMRPTYPKLNCLYLPHFLCELLLRSCTPLFPSHSAATSLSSRLQQSKPKCFLRALLQRHYITWCIQPIIIWAILCERPCRLLTLSHSHTQTEISRSGGL